MILPVISIRQPWPHAIFRLGKNVENRKWPIPEEMLKTRILIHAGKQVDKEALLYLRTNGDDTIDDLTIGGIVGIITFDRCTQNNTSQWAEPELYHWNIQRAAPVRFFPCKGTLGFFDVDYPYELPAGW